MKTPSDKKTPDMWDIPPPFQLTDQDGTVLMTVGGRPDRDDYIGACHAMPRFGGFAARIADAYFVADADNKARLRDAFPELFARALEAYWRDLE